MQCWESFLQEKDDFLKGEVGGKEPSVFLGEKGIFNVKLILEA